MIDKMIDKMIRPLDFSEIARSMITSIILELLFYHRTCCEFLLVQDLWLQLCLAPVGRWGTPGAMAPPSDSGRSVWIYMMDIYMIMIDIMILILW